MMEYSIDQPQKSNPCSLCEPGECPGCKKEVLDLPTESYGKQTEVATPRYEQTNSFTTKTEGLTSTTYKNTEKPRSIAVRSGIIIGSIFLIVALLFFKLRR